MVRGGDDIYGDGTFTGRMVVCSPSHPGAFYLPDFGHEETYKVGRPVHRTPNTPRQGLSANL